ncbi:MAG: hypothetical protein J6X84_06900 [Treponema sp.]|nr:hypothetical protein [Treponema sp.]
MILLLPLILAAWCFYKKRVDMIPVIFMGIVAAVLICGFRTFFLYSHRVIPYSFVKNVFYLLFHQSLVPIALVYGIFFLISKDSLSFKIEAIFPLLLSFYVLYLPYNIISSSEQIYTTFPLFVKPVLFTVMIFSLALAVKQIEKSHFAENSLYTAIWVGIAFGSIVFPAILESMYLLDANYFFILILSGAYSLALPILFLMNKLGILATK